MDSKKEVKKTNPIVIVGIILLVIICLPVLFGTDTPTKEETKKVEKKTNYVYSWDCTDDVTHEGKIETQIIGIGSKENADYELKPGTYKIDYKFKKYSDITSSKKYNRQYIITIVDHYIDVSELETEENQKFFMFFPDSYDTKELTFNDGEYVYIQHIATPQAGDGFVGFIKK